MSAMTSQNSAKLIVGVLALQGDFERHVVSLRQVGVTPREVRSVNDFESLDALILPGGESTTMALLLREFGMWSTLQFYAATKPIWGTCAGLILLSSSVEDSRGDADSTFSPLGALDVTVSRNAYGRQINSFEVRIEVKDGAKSLVAPVSFIRAPKITRVGSSVEILATTNDSPTLVRQNNILGSAFHTELHEDTTFLRYFLNLVSSGSLSLRSRTDATSFKSLSREVA